MFFAFTLDPPVIFVAMTTVGREAQARLAAGHAEEGETAAPTDQRCLGVVAFNHHAPLITAEESITDVIVLPPGAANGEDRHQQMANHKRIGVLSPRSTQWSIDQSKWFHTEAGSL